jgi:hypothetical protein
MGVCFVYKFGAKINKLLGREFNIYYQF